jgi:hypothetical protein
MQERAGNRLKPAHRRCAAADCTRQAMTHMRQVCKIHGEGEAYDMPPK